MGLPSQKRTKSSKRQRAAHIGIAKTGLSTCPKCKKPVRPHHACSFCGTYSGREALSMKTKGKKAKDSSKKEEKKSK